MDSDLAFHSSQELIDELMRRKTFLGVVIHSEEEWRGQGWGSERNFKVDFCPHLDTATGSRLLQIIADHIELNQLL